MAVGLRSLGIEPRGAFEHVGWPLDRLEELDEVLPLTKFRDLWQELVKTTGQSAIGIRLAMLAQPALFKPIGGILESSSTLGDALVRAARYIQLIGGPVELSLIVEAERAELIYRPLKPELLHPEVAEFTVGAIGVMARHLCGRHLIPHEVRFAHDAPPNTRLHEELFEAPVRFRQPRTGYVFDSAVLSLPVISGNSSRVTELERVLQDTLPKSRVTSEFAQRVQELIASEIPDGNPTLESIASKIGVHAKTVCRRLKSEGTSHQRLLDQMRFELADRQLRRSDVSIGEVARRLGYADTSAFNKAFKRWTGVPPQEYRRRIARRV
jgi:AraC-like DNA-binding protein